MQLPAAGPLGQGKGNINLCLYEPRTHGSFSLREFALIFNLFILLAPAADDAARRGADTSLPLPLESSSHLWSLGFTQCFSEKKRTSRQVCI